MGFNCIATRIYKTFTKLQQFLDNSRTLLVHAKPLLDN